MNLIKIGKFIAEMRKEKNLTQSMLAEKLGITDRAVSKWERGICLPDAGIMVILCEILGISVNELLTGEKITMENKEVITEKNLIELVGNLEQANKRLLRAEFVYFAIILVLFIATVFISKAFITSETLKIIIIVASAVLMLIAAEFSLILETKTGYYECKECGQKHMPEKNEVFKATFAPHMGTTRHLYCPECNKKTWQKKVTK